MYRVLEISTRNGEKFEQIICPNGTLKQVKSRINTLNRTNQVFGCTNIKYKPIKIK